MRLLIKIKETEVYVVLGGLMEDQLFINYNDELLRITRSSGEYENDFGEFMLMATLEKDELRSAKKVMKELADPKSIKSMLYVGMIKFKLKEEYLEKLEEMKV